MQLSCLAVNSNRWTFLHRALWVLSHFSRVWLFGTLWTAAHHTPQSMRFSRKEYCSGLPWPSPGDLPNPGIEPASLMSPALAGGSLSLYWKWKWSRDRLFATPWTCSPPGSSIHGIFQARKLEWVAIFFSRRSSRPRDWTQSPALQAYFLPSEPPGNWAVNYKM